MTQIYIDADGCPVKDETYKVAARYQIKVYVVANKYLTVPLTPSIEMVVVEGKFDAADDWIFAKSRSATFSSPQIFYLPNVA
jgi:uncharacterized protein YaiI (UPF0178 family)